MTLSKQWICGIALLFSLDPVFQADVQSVSKKLDTVANNTIKTIGTTVNVDYVVRLSNQAGKTKIIKCILE